MRHIAFVGTPVSLKDLTSWIRNIVTSGDILEGFKQVICKKFNINHCFFLSSGRAALFLLLQSLRELSGNRKKEVIIPSYTCYSVPVAIAKAGLKIRICDIDVNTLDYDIQKLSGFDFSEVLCIVTSNLFGIPNDLITLGQIAREHGVYLIDDAAQCMGGKIADGFSGTFGDAGIYSLSISKNITSIQGGIIVTNSDAIASLIKPKIATLPEITIERKLLYLCQLIGYSIFLHPAMCWLPANLPFLNFEDTFNVEDFSVDSYWRLLGAMGLQLFSKLDEITETRIKNAGYLKENLNDIPFINLIKHSNYSSPVYLRFPLLIYDKKNRDTIVRRLKEKGIGVAQPYLLSVADIQGIQNVLETKDTNAESGRLVATQLITLPTHPYITKDDLDSIISIIKSIIKK